jgi:hypothetical protein
MPSALTRRLDRLEAKAAPARPAARYVVDSWQDYHRVGKLFREPWEGWRLAMVDPEEATAEERAEREAYARRLSDASLPVEQRYTYAEAVEAGVVVETEAYRAAVWASECKEARHAYAYAREYVERFRGYAPVRAYDYARVARDGHTPWPGTSAPAMAAEAGCEDAAYCLAYAEAFEAEHPDAEALLQAFREEERARMMRGSAAR